MTNNIPNLQQEQSAQQVNNFHLIRSMDRINGLITKPIRTKPQRNK